MNKQKIIGLVMIIIGIILIIISALTAFNVIEWYSDEPAVWTYIGEAAWVPRYGNAVIFNYNLYKTANQYRTLYKIVKKNDSTEQYYIADNHKPITGGTLRIANPTHPESTTVIVRL